MAPPSRSPEFMVAKIKEFADRVGSAPVAFVFVTLLLLGGWMVMSRFLRSLAAFWRIFLRPGVNLKKYGKWAVITGATDGIGRAIADELAFRQFNLLLISRSAEKLKVAAEEIRSTTEVEVQTLTLDFASATPAAYTSLKAAVTSLDVGILVNNVGASYPYPMYLHEVDDALVGTLIRVNVEGTTAVTRAVLPGMLSRKRGAIVMIGSAAATALPSEPLYAVYAATKAYVDQLARVLHVEYKAQGIDVQLQAPFYVSTKMSKIRNASLTVPTPATYARAALRSIGYEARVAPFWAHALMWGVLTAIPEQLVDALRLNMCLDLRRRALKKQAAGKKE